MQGNEKTKFPIRSWIHRTQSVEKRNKKQKNKNKKQNKQKKRKKKTLRILWFTP